MLQLHWNFSNFIALNSVNMKSISFCSNLFLIWIWGMPVRLSIPSLICKTTCFQDSIDDAFFCEDIHNPAISSLSILSWITKLSAIIGNDVYLLFPDILFWGNFFPLAWYFGSLFSESFLKNKLAKSVVTTRVKNHSIIKNHTIRNQATSSILFENFIKNLTTGSDKVTWTKKRRHNKP